MAQTIIAQKGKLRKRFNLDSWNLLKDKNGWVPPSVSFEPFYFPSI